MKKLYPFLTVFLLINVSISVCAQTIFNWSIRSIKEPTEIQSNTTNTTFNLAFECQNLGDSTIKTGDSITVRMVALDKTTAGLVLQFPNNASTGNAVIYNATKNIVKGDTFNFNIGLTANFSTPHSRDIRLRIYSYLWNRTNPIHDFDSTNNEKYIDIKWWDEKKWPVSVQEINNNQNNILVYPNPASEKFTIKLNDGVEEKMVVKLFDMTGKSVLEADYIQLQAPNQWVINTSALKNGIYILQVNNGNKVITSKVTISH